MISDDELYRLAIFLGITAVVLIVLYHFLEINSSSDQKPEKATLLNSEQQFGKSHATR
jgi:oligosaccharyl transferase complex subunit OST4